MKKQELTEGDYFIIPLYFLELSEVDNLADKPLIKENDHAYGRIIDIRNVGIIVEIFKYTGPDIGISSDLTSERLFDPICVSHLPFQNWRWRIVGKTEGFTKDMVGYSDIRLILGKKSRFKLWQGGESLGRIKTEDAKGIERFIVWRAPHLEKRIINDCSLQ